MIPLPPAFAARMKKQLGGGAAAFFTATEHPPVRGLRINPLKTPPDAAMPDLNSPVPWAAHGQYLDAESAAGALPQHAGGAYYLQEPSAMLPAELPDVKPGQTVLDLCAAPGGKSTQLAAKMAGKGTLVCNDPVPARAGTLGSNLERMGVRNSVAVSADPSRLMQLWPRLFDVVLVDAPCSGEGMFRKSPETRLEWSAEAPASCARRQLRILDDAAVMLKAGGRLCYSTCTFSEEENESVIHAFLSCHPEFRPVEFSIPIGNERTLSSQNGCLRLYPHEIRGEGHFAALLEKTEVRPNEPAPAALLPAGRVLSIPDQETLDAFRALWAELSAEEPPHANAMIGGLLLCAPPLPALDGVKVYRAGLALGRRKGRVFIPNHALALAAPPAHIRSIPLDEKKAAAYLRGETLPAGDLPNGFWTVSYAGLPLGFVKHSDSQLKNHYPKGLRRR